MITALAKYTITQDEAKKLSPNFVKNPKKFPTHTGTYSTGYKSHLKVGDKVLTWCMMYGYLIVKLTSVGKNVRGEFSVGAKIKNIDLTIEYCVKI